ncbi:MAG: hypothetical protein DRJ56_08935 [Thermoprotei archaeon]|nr:MAG: hypothetical protein DRJ56_08935 [Thermoprotei archaeon]
MYILYVALITVRVDEETKRKMEALRHINWSEVVREAIRRVIEREEARNLARAVLLNERNVVVPDPDFSSVRVIRAWRERG